MTGKVSETLQNERLSGLLLTYKIDKIHWNGNYFIMIDVLRQNLPQTEMMLVKV